MAGTNNDLNVLDASPLFQDIFNNDFSLTITGNYKIIEGFCKERKMPYFLVDGIYPHLAILAGTVADPTIVQQQYKIAQDAIRKEVESTYCVMMARSQILKSAINYLKHEDVVALTGVCVILHNMIIGFSEDVVATCGGVIRPYRSVT